MKREKQNLFRSFQNACRGLFVLSHAERNFKIELFFAVFAIALAYFLDFDFLKMSFVLVVAAFVLVAEIFNTTIEKTMDLVHPDYSEKVKDIKDLASGAVFLAVLLAVFLFALLYLPEIFDLIEAYHL